MNQDNAAIFKERYISLADLSIESYSQFIGQIDRNSLPLLLKCEIEALGVTDIVFLSPINKFFSGVGLYPAMRECLCQYTYENFVQNELFNKAFCSRIKKEGIKKEYLATSLFWPYAGFGGYEGFSGVYGKKFVGEHLVPYGRLISALVENGLVQKIESYFLNQLRQFGALSYIDAGEDLTALIGAAGFEEMPGFGGFVYESRDYTALFQIISDQKTGDESFIRTQEIIEELKVSKEPLDVINLFPLHATKFFPYHPVIPGHPLLDIIGPLAVNRSEIVLRLKWPWYYDGAKSRINYYEKRLNDCRSSKAAIYVDEILQNLNEYLSDMERRYPVINETLFA